MKWDFATDKMPDHDVVLYARFSAGDYTVTFNNEGETSTQTAEYNTLITEPEKPTKVGYTFDGWYDAQTGGTKWNFSTDKMLDHDLTLYARYILNDYTVTFVDEGTTSTQVVNYDALITEPTAPTKTGYTFDGWYTEISNGEKWNFSTDKMPDTDLTLYARFTINEYTLTFNNDGETTTQLVNYDTLLTEPLAPTKVGYTFIGWYDAETGGTKWNFSTDKMPANDHTLYARYAVGAYTVTYDNQGNTKTETVEFGELLTEPADPTKSGYQFIGWYESVDDIIWNFRLDKVPARDITLTAQFKAENQTITFDTNGGSEVADLVAPTDSEIDISGVTIPTKAGYQFVGWFDEDDKQVTGTITMPVGGMRLKAEWTASDQVIIFNTNGGTGVDSILAKTGDTFNIDDQVTSRAGYTFSGWYDEKDQKVTGIQTVKAGGATYTAKWQAEDQTITFDVNGGDAATQPESITAPTNSEVNLDEVMIPTRAGYIFEGWFDDEKQLTGKITMPAGGLNLKAKWSAEDQVIQFNANGGTSVPTLLLKIDETYDLDQQTTTRAGYTFEGWYDEKDQKVTGIQTVKAGGATYTAKWQAEDQTITFDVNGGDAATQPESITAPTDSEVNLNEIALPKRAGYTFIGWFDGKNQVAGVITMPAGGLELKAKWLADNQEIHFNANGGTEVATLTVKTDETYDLDKQITLRPGYQFLGWYNEADELKTGKQTVVIGGATYTAKWQAADQTITFDLNGGDAATQPAAIKAPTNSKVDLTKVKQPTRAGYTFIGWYNGESQVYETVIMPAGGMTLTAKWQKKAVGDDTDKKTGSQVKSSKSVTNKGTEAQIKATKNGLPSTGETPARIAVFLGIVLIITGGFLFYKKRKL
ncbi:LPXTG cell wall anchor domain-containing protein [Erwinia sp. CPCC 100877]|nr:LPXTG cell wall anchor domain-containing protein [Erwinia sp. CPCC 100877]